MDAAAEEALAAEAALEEEAAQAAAAFGAGREKEVALANVWTCNRMYIWEVAISHYI